VYYFAHPRRWWRSRKEYTQSKGRVFPGVAPYWFGNPGWIYVRGNETTKATNPEGEVVVGERSPMGYILD
jgi:hypothetical protein